MLHANKVLAAALVASLFTAMPALSGQDAAGGKKKPEEVKQLMATLQSPEAGHFDKALACRKLAVIGTEEAVPALAALLADEKLSHMARFGLEPMPFPAAGAALRDAMGKLKGKLLVGVLNSIGQRRDVKAVTGLKKLLSDADAEVAAAAAAALGRIGTPETATILEQALVTAPASLRTSFGDAGLMCGDVLTAEGRSKAAVALFDALRKMELPRHQVMAAMRGAMLARSADGLPLLLDQLRSPDTAMFAVALRVARELPGSKVTQALAAELGKLPADKQELLLEAIGDRGDTAVLPPVIEAAKSGPAPVRIAAIRVLARMGNVAAVPVLLKAAAQPDAAVAKAAQAALGKLSGKQVDAALVANVNQGDKQLRRAAIEAVAQRRVTAAVPALLKAAGDADADIRLAAIRALGETVDAPDFGSLANLFVKAKTVEDSSAAEAALSRACVRITDKAACGDKLLACLPQATPEAKRALLQLLAQVGGAKPLQAVRAAAQDADPQVKDAAIRALADWPDLAAAPDLLQIIRTTDNAAHRVLAFRGYVRLGGEAEAAPDAKLKILIEAMGLAKNQDDKKLVLGALGEVNSVEALRLAAKQLTDADTADEAGAAIIKITESLDAKYNAEAMDTLKQVIKLAKAQSVLDNARRQLRRLGKEK